MAISDTRKGNIGLHIISVNEMDESKFINFFNGNIEEIQFAIDDENGFIARLGPHDVETARERLNKALEFAKNGDASADEALADLPTVAAVNINGQGEPVLGKPLIENYSPNVEIIATDSGSFYHLEMWKLKLSHVYKYIEGFGTIFANACQEVGIDPTIDYISEAKKKSVTRKLKSCTKAYLDKLADEV